MDAFDPTMTVKEEVKEEVKDIVKEEVDMFADNFVLDDYGLWKLNNIR